MPGETPATPRKPHLPSLFRLFFRQQQCLAVRTTVEVDHMVRFLSLSGVSFRIKVVKKRQEPQFYVFMLIGDAP